MSRLDPSSEDDRRLAFDCHATFNDAKADWWTARLHPEDRNRIVESLERMLAGDDDRWPVEYRFARPDGGGSLEITAADRPACDLFAAHLQGLAVTEIIYSREDRRAHAQSVGSGRPANSYLNRWATQTGRRGRSRESLRGCPH